MHKAVGKKAGRRKPEGRGEREKEEDELRAKQRAVLDRTALWK